MRHAPLVAERDALAAAVPEDWREQVGRHLDAISALGRQRDDLTRGAGRYADTAVGAAARELSEARRQRERAEALAASPSSSRRQRKSFSKEAERWLDREGQLQRRWQRLASPELARLDDQESSLREADRRLCERVRKGREWLEQHPELAPRLARLEREIQGLERAIDPEGTVFEPPVRPEPWVRTLERGRAIEPPGLDLAL